MEFFDSINHYLMTHPVMIEQLESILKIKSGILLGLAAYFVLLPYREQKKQRQKQKQLSKQPGHFLA